MKSFTHHNADSLGGAVATAGEGARPTCWMAGGTDLLGVLKDEILPEYPATVVNLKTIPGLDRVEPDGEGMRLGSLAKLLTLAGHTGLRDQFPVLAAAAESVATPEIRNMATLGGNLCQDNRCWYYRYPHHMGGRMLCKRKGSGPCHAVRGDNRYHVVTGGKGCFAPCPSDTAVALSALDASLEIAGPEGVRALSIHDFYTPMGHVLGPDEVLTGVRIPAPPAGTRQGFQKFTVRKPVDFAIVSVAALVVVRDGTCREARISLGGVAPAPLRAEAAEQALVGSRLESSDVAEAAELVLADARPLSRNAYKIDIARNLVREVLGSIAQ
jgi:xanthine dehydrogenase YagS FAD-binding subunit